MCGWASDPTHDFEWKRRNGIVTKRQLRTGPRHDHTTMVPLEGHYMIAESQNKFENASARLLSPIYPASNSVDACFKFYFHMYGSQVGRLRVYLKPLSIPMSLVLSEARYPQFNLPIENS